MTILSYYQRSGSRYWYCKYLNDKGAVVRVSTGEETQEAAIRYIQSLKTNRMGLAIGVDAKFSAILAVYANPETNPRKLAAKMDGTSYGESHAKRASAVAKKIERLLRKDAPELLSKYISKFNKADCYRIKEIIYVSYGNTRNAQETLEMVKTFFSQAETEGRIELSPFRSIRNIKYESKRRIAIPAENLAAIIEHKEMFVTEKAWAFFTILATTGMRKSEVLALETDQFFDSTLTIDRALKSDKISDVGLPKWNLKRVIPLSKTTMNAVKAIWPSEGGKLFNFARSSAYVLFMEARTVAMSLMPEFADDWQQMTPHILRHSINTNLLIEGRESPILVASYLSWNHQTFCEMQQRYTHVYAKDLQSVADCIDKIYKSPKEQKRKIREFKAKRA